jgi:hypothetical protein
MRLGRLRLDHNPRYRPPEGLEQRIRELTRAAETARPAVEDAARAIALHNIYTEGFDPDRAAARWLALQRFRLHWEEQPLAALLSFCDVLQGWDRPGFQGARFSMPSMSDQELLICANDGGIHVAYHGPNAAERERQTRMALDAVLDREFVSGLCRWDARPTEALVERARRADQRPEVEEIQPKTPSAPDSPVVGVDDVRLDPAAVARYAEAEGAERRGQLAEAWQLWSWLADDYGGFRDVLQRRRRAWERYRDELGQAVREALGSSRIKQAQASFAELRGLDPKGAAAKLERELAEPCRFPVECIVPAGVFWRGLELRQAQLILDAVARRGYNLDLSEEGRERFLLALTHDQRRREEHPAFLLDRYPVTNDQFSRFLILTGHVTEVERRRGDDWLTRFMTPERMDHPVVNITFDDADAYARWAGRRLPTCAERDRAAQGLDGRAYPWGDEYVQTNCNAADDLPQWTTNAVHDFESVESPFGIVDLVGNVDEITSDTEGPDHLAVGGSWKQACEIYGLPGFRRGFRPGDAFDDLGFRTARDGTADPAPLSDHG